MRDKKIIIAVLLVIFAVGSLVYGIIAPVRGKAHKGTIIANEPLIPLKGSISVERRAKRSSFKSWKRSPFVSGGSASSDLVLNGIIWNKQKPKAMIGDTIVVKGTKIGDNTVVDIKPDRVILNDGTKEFELRMEK